MHVRKDGQALVTGSADKDVKFWDFEAKDSQGEQVSWCSLYSKYKSSTVSERHFPLVGAHTNSENDGRCLVCTV